MLSEKIANAMEAAPAAFANAWAKAPPFVDYKGRRYSANSADTPLKKTWYLAAAAMESPQKVAGMAPFALDDSTGVYRWNLDADPSELNAARTAYAQARAKVTGIQQKINAYRKERERWVKEKKKAEDSTFKDFGSIITLGLANVAGSGFAQSKISWYDDQIEQMGLQLAQAQSDETAAKAMMEEAQRNYDAQTRAIRQQEEQARQEQLRQRQQEQAAALAAQQAAQREAQAQAASTSYWYMPSAASSGGYPVPGQDMVLGAAQGEIWDPWGDSGMGGAWIEDQTPWGLDLRQAADLIDTHGGGDPEAAVGYLHSVGEDLPGLTRHASAWCFDRYYGAAAQDYAEKTFGIERIGKNLFGADEAQGSGSAAQVFTAITNVLASILQNAPAILDETRGKGPHPADGVKSQPGTMDLSGATKAVLDATGINKILDEKAAKAGAEAGARAQEGATQAGMFIALGIILAAVLITGKKPPAAG